MRFECWETATTRKMRCKATFLRAYRALNRYQERDRFSAWLYRILVNQCRSVAARRAHRDRVFVREEALLLNARIARPIGLAKTKNLFSVCSTSWIRCCGKRFFSKHIDEMSYEEMSALTGVGVSALKMRVKRACDRLRDRWERIKDD